MNLLLWYEKIDGCRKIRNLEEMAPLAWVLLGSLPTPAPRAFPAEPTQPVLVRGEVPFQVQDFSFLLAELHEVPVSSFLQWSRSLWMAAQVSCASTAPTLTQCHLQTCWEWLPPRHLSFRWRHQATLSGTIPWKTLLLNRKKLDFNQWPLLFDSKCPTGF